MRVRQKRRRARGFMGRSPRTSQRNPGCGIASRAPSQLSFGYTYKGGEMRAILFEDVGKISLGDYPEPSVQEPSDAVVKITTSAICGSDLHLLHGPIPGMRPGSVTGHEVVGTGATAGPALTSVQSR